MRSIPFKALLLTVFSLGVFATCAPAATVKAALKSASVRPQAPAFRLMNASGETEQLANYRGKVVLLNFWATDCGGCRLEIPWLVDLDRAFQKKSVAVIGISMDISYEDLRNATEAWARVRPFVASHQISYPILMGDNEVTKHYGIEALPVSYLIDARGRVAAVYVGLIDEDNVKGNINTLLAEDR